MAPRRRRDGQPAGDGNPPEGAEGAGEQLKNAYGKAEIEADMAEVRELNQKISDLQMKVAGVFKRIEKSGGDRKAFKWAYQLRYQDPAKTKAQLADLRDYIEWMVEPELAKAEAAGSEG